MDRDLPNRQTALRARAEEAIRAALAAADAHAHPVTSVLADAMAAVDLACWDPGLEPTDRLALIDEALRLMIPLKELATVGRAARPNLIAEVSRRTSGLLRRYAALIPRVPPRSGS
jgi:hypothetical protein